jgi:hypothetical protein
LVRFGLTSSSPTVTEELSVSFVRFVRRFTDAI